MYDLTISIVLYKSNIEKLQAAIDSVRETGLKFKIYLIDNSPTDELRRFAADNTEYIFNNANLGFGKAHNIALQKAIAESRYHLILNPDVYFEPGCLETLHSKMESDPAIGLISPKILYPDGSLQTLCKLLPTPFDLFLRRFFGNASWVQRRNIRYELHESGYDKEMNIPSLSGCFMFLRSSVIEEVGFFDERIFMYTEDADLARRIHRRYKTLFYPYASIYHYFEKGSYRNGKLMMYHIHGAIVYFCKWGWFFDDERTRINRRVVSEYINKR